MNKPTPPPYPSTDELAVQLPRLQNDASIESMEMLPLQHSGAVDEAGTQNQNTKHFDSKFNLVKPRSRNVILIQRYKKVPSCEVFSNACDDVSVQISLTHPVHS